MHPSDSIHPSYSIYRSDSIHPSDLRLTLEIVQTQDIILTVHIVLTQDIVQAQWREAQKYKEQSNCNIHGKNPTYGRH